MRATIDGMGRVVIPKAFRDALGLTAGSEIDISSFGGGLHLEPGSRAAALEREGGHLVVTGDTVVDDELLFAAIDAGRR